MRLLARPIRQLDNVCTKSSYLLANHAIMLYPVYFNFVNRIHYLLHLFPLNILNKSIRNVVQLLNNSCV